MTAFALATGGCRAKTERPAVEHCSFQRAAFARRSVRASASAAAEDDADEAVAGAKVPNKADAELIKAALDGDVRAVETLLKESGAAPTAVDENGRSPLHFAAGMGIPKTCEMLVECGAELNLPDVTGYTPLHMAAGYLRPSTVQTLIDLGADPDIRSPTGETALELAQKLLDVEPEKKFFRANGRHTKLKEVVEVLTPVTTAEPLLATTATSETQEPNEEKPATSEPASKAEAPSKDT